MLVEVVANLSMVRAWIGDARTHVHVHKVSGLGFCLLMDLRMVVSGKSLGKRYVGSGF